MWCKEHLGLWVLEPPYTACPDIHRRGEPYVRGVRGALHQRPLVEPSTRLCRRAFIICQLGFCSFCQFVHVVFHLTLVYNNIQDSCGSIRVFSFPDREHQDLNHNRIA